MEIHPDIRQLTVNLEKYDPAALMRLYLDLQQHLSQPVDDTFNFVLGREKNGQFVMFVTFHNSVIGNRQYLSRIVFSTLSGSRVPPEILKSFSDTEREIFRLIGLLTASANFVNKPLVTAF